MAKDLNKVMLTGHLGADPEMRYTESGNAVTSFRVASGRSWKSEDGTQHDDTEWFRVVAWNKLGEICNQYLSKGARVYIEGRLQTRQWQDQEGVTRYSTEVIANDMIMLSNRQDRQGQQEESDEEPAAPVAPPQRRTAPAPVSPAAAMQRGVPAARAATGNGNARGGTAPRPAARNVPQAIDNDEDLPF